MTIEVQSGIRLTGTIEGSLHNFPKPILIFPEASQNTPPSLQGMQTDGVTYGWDKIIGATLEIAALGIWYYLRGSMNSQSSKRKSLTIL